MKRYNFLYSTKIEFAAPVANHFFQLRCIPSNTSFQQLTSIDIKVTPEVPLLRNIDTFGTLVLSGTSVKDHSLFSFAVLGEVLLSNYVNREELDTIYLYPSFLTKPSESLVSFLKTLEIPGRISNREKAHLLVQSILKVMKYKAETTDITTTADEAFAAGEGVCQDYAHLLITLCRLSGIPARYSVGFMCGEGQTHAWVEIYDKGAWYGIDPTNNKKVDYGYIKIAHGRDYNDCPVDKGSFTCEVPNVTQVTTTKIVAEEKSL